MDHKTTNRLMRLSEVQRLTALPKSSIYPSDEAKRLSSTFEAIEKNSGLERE